MKNSTRTNGHPPISCVDLFCGAGGLSHGLLRQGVTVSAGIDIDPACKYPYEANNGGAAFLEADVEKLTAKKIQSLFAPRSLRLLAGCAPCQPFSTYSQGRDTSADKKWSLLRSFGRLVKNVQPELVTMENVPKLPEHEIFQEFLRAFKGYSVWYEKVNCLDYGIPQSRTRLVLLASKLGPIRLIDPTHSKGEYVTVEDVISSLPPIGQGEQHSLDSLHAAAGMTPINLARIQQSKPGGTWRDWDPGLVADCHTKKSGKTYPSVYGRMAWDRPAPTMTTLCYGFGNGRFGHPTQNRAISLREAALFQTFPKSYKFLRSGERAQFKSLGRLIGNAVPVRLGEVIAKSISRHLRSLSK